MYYDMHLLVFYLIELFTMKQLAMMVDEAKMLETETFRGSEPSSRSPRHGSSHGFRGSSSSSPRDLHSSSESLSARTVPSPGSRTRAGS